MKKLLLLISALSLLFGCATYKPKYVEDFDAEIEKPDKKISHTFYLIGDAGLSPYLGMNPALEAFKKRLY